jgi:hypothetical protein
MMGRGNSILGIAFTADNTLACAEVTITAGVRAVRHAAVFVLPGGATLETAASAGPALAAFLREHQIGASRAVVGVPAKWLVALEKELPPADEAQAHAALRLQAERLAVAESGEMVFDFAGQTHRSTMSKVLLVGMQRQRLERIVGLLESAGLSVAAVTSSGLSLSTAIKGDDGGVMTLNRAGGELVWRQSGAARMLRHVPLGTNGEGPPSTAALAGEFRRMIAMAGSNGTAGSRSLLLIDSLGLSGEQIESLSSRLGVAVQSKAQRELLRVDASGAAATPELAPAIALALVAADDELPLDFAHSRLTAPTHSRFGRIGVIGIAAAALILLGLIGLFILVQVRESQLSKLQAESRATKDQVTAARAVIDRLRLGRGYFEPDKRTPVLECLKDISQAFRPEDRIWATSFGFKDSPDGYKGTLAVKAADRSTVLAFGERLQKNRRFTSWNPGEIREIDARSREVSFSVTFDFNTGE